MPLLPRYLLGSADPVPRKMISGIAEEEEEQEEMDEAVVAKLWRNRSSFSSRFAFLSASNSFSFNSSAPPPPTFSRAISSKTASTSSSSGLDP